MKAYIFKTAFAIAALAFISVGCDKDDDAPTPPTPTNPYSELYKIAEMPATGSGYNVALYMNEEPFMGFNYTYAVITDATTGALVENAMVSFMPMMDMGTMQHTCPQEAPVWSADAKANKGAIVLTMPSTAGSWTIKVMVENPATMTMGEAVFPVTVIDKAQTRLFTFLSTVDNRKFIVAYVQPEKPKVGLNDFEVAVYEKVSMMDFPAITDLNIAIDPEMPSMGHGSPNNVNPTHIDMGHYKGTVNFTMTGYWKINMAFKNAANEMMYDKGYFDVTFQ